MKNKKENGEVVVEASIVVTLVVIVLSIMFYIGMVFYQQTAISVVANRTATNIAQVYSNALRDPFTGYINPDSAYQSVTYSNMKTDAQLEAIKEKAITFANYRLKKTQIIPSFDRDVDVEIINKPNELLKSQIVVNITDSYNVALLGFFGIDGDITFSASGRADCVDYLEYLYGVKAISNPEESPIPSLPDSDTCVVTFIKDKYSGTFHAAVPVLRNKTIITSNRHSHSTMPENPVFNDMEFKGWFTEDGRPFSATFTVNENITVYGNWDCTITFDPTGGTVNPTSKKVPYNKPAELPTPQKYSFKFLGWYSDVEYSNEYKSNNGKGTLYTTNVTPIPGNITLYASWECTHAEYTHKQLREGNCQVPSRWLRECKFCDYSYEDNGDYGTHNPSGKIITTEPSCTNTGWSLVKCTICSSTLSEKSEAALGHRYANGKSGPYDQPYSREATCITTGFRGSKCSRCGAIQGETLSTTKHNLNSGTVTKSATCVRKEEGYYSCKNSGCDYTEKYIGNYAAHSYTARCGVDHHQWQGNHQATLKDTSKWCEKSKDTNTTRGIVFQCCVCRWCGRYIPPFDKYTDGSIKVYEEKAVYSFGGGKARTIKENGKFKRLKGSIKNWCQFHDDFANIPECEVKVKHYYE